MTSRLTIPDSSQLPPAEDAGNVGHLERVLRSGQFTVTAELAPPDSADPQEVHARAQLFAGHVDAMNATDGSGANCHMSSVAMCALLAREGHETVMQISCRDRNRIAIQGDVLGAAALGIRNLLCLTGDGVQVGDHPEAKPVFDLDSLSLLEIVAGLRDKHAFASGRTLTSAPQVFLGAAANPFAPPFAFRPHRLAKKIAAGAQFIQTQYCFDLPRFQDFMHRARDLGLLEKCFILPGVGPLASARTAEWMRRHVPGVHIPDDVLTRLKGAKDQKAEGRDICIEMIQQLREIEGVSGVHIMAHRQEAFVPEIIQRAGILGARRPYTPQAPLGATPPIG
ncbi:methylenetetrahydrofolate reductase [Cobetia sp. 1CM21F]|uniref:methylenetetrahydrofolate reductase n=1 Tax=Cobetia sp. 1CM21F TaxID=2929163 RepID=UPI0020BF34B2|nr:methylenetetrahydrofolate reductase [Cobetia sp. 1CM21F]MCK8066862.1 methylenetetrahydrofolate reductase [Cobetia sp. 1CM21F]